MIPPIPLFRCKSVSIAVRCLVPVESAPMRRRLFTLAAGASAVFFTTVCVVWLRSETHHDMLIVRLGDDRAGWVESVHGGVQFGMMTNTP
jgi:hypothetical protein